MKEFSSAPLLWATLIAAFAGLPLLPGIPDFWITLWDYIGIYSLVAIGLVLLTGVGGMTSFGQAAFAGFGAYTSAVLTSAYGFSPWAALPFAIVVTGLGALLYLGTAANFDRPIVADRCTCRLLSHLVLRPCCNYHQFEPAR